MLKKNKAIFITYAEKKSGAYFEFRYSLDELRYSLCEKDSLFVPINSHMIFFDEYLKYLTPTKTPNGGTQFDGCGINYYTKEQARIMFDKIQKDKPKEYTVLLSWLEKLLSSPSKDGFYILGV